jgi:hypothetical protein
VFTSAKSVLAARVYYEKKLVVVLRMKIQLLILVICAIFNQTFNASALDRNIFGMPNGFNPNGDKELIITRAGKVWFIDNGQHPETAEFFGSYLKLNDKIIGKFDGYPVGSIEKRITAKDFDLLLFTVDFGGSGTLPELRAVSIKPNGEYHFFDNFLTESFNDATIANNLAYKVTDNNIYIDLGFEGKLNKKAEISYDYLKLTKQKPDHNATIPVKLCKELYIDMQHVCSRTLPRDANENCKNKGDNIGLIYHRAVFNYDDFPWFSSDNTLDLCNTICAKGRKSITPSFFMKKACGIK